MCGSWACAIRVRDGQCRASEKSTSCTSVGGPLHRSKNVFERYLFGANVLKKLRHPDVDPDVQS